MKYLIVMALLAALVGCVPPTKNTQGVDDRPGLSFDLANSKVAGYKLVVDGISYGALKQYREGESLLKLVDGTHYIEVFDNGNVVFSQKIYLGTGTNRIINVGPNE